MGESILKQKSFLLAKTVVATYQYLNSEKKEYVMSKQLLRSGTSVGAMVREARNARNAESKMDFIHKLGIAQKECDESLYWLELLLETGYIDDSQYKSVSKQAEEELRIIRSSIITTKNNIAKRKL
ncbi:MAG: four helix bundle protein [Ferruginibacter sp.]|nr:four helix bundle protein [Ferruginibacter sp.]